MLRMLILLRVRVAESQEKSKNAKDGNRNFLITRDELFQSVTTYAKQYGLKAFNTENPLEEFTAEILDLLENGLLNFTKGYIRRGDTNLFDQALKSDSFVKYVVLSTGDLFLKELADKP